MKVPFAMYLGPILKFYQKEIGYICAPCLLGSKIYISSFSIVGLIVTLMDIIILLKRNSVAPTFLVPYPRNQIICPRIQKGLKMLSCGLNLNYYFLLALGAYFDQAILFMPYLGLQGLGIVLFMVYTFITLGIRGNGFKKRNILILGFMIHNWFQVLCQFRSLLRPADY